MKTFHCEKCGQRVETHIVEREEEFPVKGEPIAVRCSVRICAACGDDIYDKELDSAALEAAYDIYRQRHRVLSPEEIRSLREQYGLSQRSLAALLGWGEVTVHRYENGCLPDEAHNLLLKLVREPENMARVFTDHGNRLPDRARRALEKRLQGLLGEKRASEGAEAEALSA